ncbi:MAG: MMPL family transporter [Bacteroidales bacterium]|nr:MMPL family transporter [Bacteroidales bacterium]MBR4715148.1 MMPL family transporter [Bacteroidales bacterium]
MKSNKINAFFGRYAAFLLRWRWAAIALFAVVLAVSFIGMSKMVQQTSFDDYFIEGDPMLVKTNEFKENFGNDYFIGILTECDNHFTKENLTLMRELGEELLDSLSYGDKITSLVDLEFMLGTEDGMEIVQIVSDEIPETGSPEMEQIRSLAYSKPHVARKLISKDGRNAWILVKLRAFPSEEEWKQTSNVSPDIVTGEEVSRVITKEKYASLHPKATGMPYVTQQKSVYIGQEMGRLVMIAAIICIIVMLLMTRSLRGIVGPLLSVIGGIVITFGIAGYSQMYVDSTVLMIPAILAFAVAIAYNIHIFSYFNQSMRRHGKRKQAVVETISEIGWSVVFCGLTTVISLMSFMVIPIRPMKCVGMMSSLTILFVLFTTLLMAPVLLSFGKDKKPKPGVDGEGGTRLGRAMERLNDFTFKFSKPIIAVFAVVCVALGIGLWKIEPAFDIERTMGKAVPYVNDVLTVGRSELGALYSYDLVMEFKSEDDAKQPENLRKLEQLEELVGTYSLTKRTNSILDIIKDLNQTLNGGDKGHYRIPETEEGVAQMLMLYENAGGSEAEYWMDYGYKRLRLMVEISDFNSAEVERELNDIAKKSAEMFPDVTVTAVGNIPQYTTMMQYLVRGQMQSFLISVLIIAVILMIAFQSIRVGLIGLIPNLMPAIFVGGFMGWMGIPLDMMTATLIPMMLGMAVDDTIHFFNHSKLEFDRTPNYSVSIRRTFRVVGVAIVTTSIITSAVFACFATSACTMCVNFGVLAVIGIISALLADLFITPLLVKKFKVYGKETINK